MTVQVFDPTIEAKSRRIDFVPRPKSLAGLRVGLVDNSKFNSDQVLERVGKLLERDYGVTSHVMLRKVTAGIPASPAIIAEFKANCDIVVAGVGD